MYEIPEVWKKRSVYFIVQKPQDVPNKVNFDVLAASNDRRIFCTACGVNTGCPRSLVSNEHHAKSCIGFLVRMLSAVVMHKTVKLYAFHEEE